jgi:hypothetical protein
MTRESKNILLIFVIIICFIVYGVLNFGSFFINSYSPPQITVKKNAISMQGGFMNPVTIEKLKVDSLGKDKRPTKYTTEYITTCFIKQIDTKTPIALNEIKFNQIGRYSWSEKNVTVFIKHPDGLSKRIFGSEQPVLDKPNQALNICPLKFENKNWYFIDFQDPIFIGVYIYVDQDGKIHQYATYSGKLPI